MSLGEVIGTVDEPNHAPSSQYAPADNPSDLLYGTYLGGGAEDGVSEIAVDSSGRAIIMGDTYSANFPSKPGSFDPSFNGGVDIFVVRLNAAGSALDYATFLGGNSWDFRGDLAIDASGRLDATGYTYSRNFPTTPGAFKTNYNGPNSDAFVVRLNAAGTALEYSTFLGGSNGNGGELGDAIALDSSGRAFVTGQTSAVIFRNSWRSSDTSFNGGQYGGDGFVVRLNSTGTALDYSTYLGGTRDDIPRAIVVDSTGRPYVTGYTRSETFPTTPGAFDTSFNGSLGDYDIFAVRLNTNFGSLSYATFLGGSAIDTAADIALKAGGQACLTGRTVSPHFP